MRLALFPNARYAPCMSDTTSITVRLPVPLAARLRASAEARDRTASDVARAAIARDLGGAADAAEMPPHPGGPGRGHKGTRES